MHIGNSVANGLPGGGFHKCPLQLDGETGIFLKWMEGSLSPEESALLERHAGQCPACRSIMQEHQAVWSALDVWEPGEVSPDFNRNLYAAIDRERRLPWWKRALAWVSPLPVRPAVPLATSCLLLLAVLLFQSPVSPDFKTKQAGIYERVDVEQVDRSLDDLNLLRELHEELKLESAAAENL